MKYLMMHSTHFIYHYVAMNNDKEPLRKDKKKHVVTTLWATAAKDLLCALSHIQNSTYEKDNFIKKIYIVLSCLSNSILF